MTPSDFIEDESFRRWVFSTAPDDVYWKNYLERHPEHRESAALARTFLLTAKGELPNMPDQQVREAVGRILSAGPAQPRRRLLPGWSSWQLVRVAASVALLFVAGWFGRQYWQLNQPATPVARTPVAVQPSASMTEITNQRSAPRLVRLADGSLVVLQRNARIRFPNQFTGPRRDVLLTGNAFFEVVRNPAKPFRVLTRELTTEVLGTSFLINAPETGGSVNVVVKTGKVTVSTNPAAGVPATNNQIAGQRSGGRRNTDGPQPVAVVLLPNQQATFSTSDARLVKSNVGRAAATVLPATTQPFSFRRTPLPTVLDALAKAYRIDIQFNRDELANCTLTAQLDDPSLFARLDVIAASTGSTYELQNGQLVIHSSGCR